MSVKLNFQIGFHDLFVIKKKHKQLFQYRLISNLSHFVHFSLPAQSLVVQRIVVRSDKYRLPVQMVARPLARVEHANSGFGLGTGPFLELGHRVTVGAHFFVERDGRTVFQHGHL